MKEPNAPKDNTFEDDDFFGQAMRHVGKKQLSEDTDSSAAFKASLSYFRRHILAQLKDIGSYSKYVRQMPPIYLDLTDELHLNAFTFNYLGRGVIALSGAVPSIIHSTMFRLLSDRNIMPDIGNPENELPIVPFIPFTNDFNELARHHATSRLSIESYIPKDATREATARFMATMAIHFVIAHEFRHIQAGHNDYNLQTIKTPLIEEVSFIHSDTNKAMISQAMEMDADAFGILSLLRIVRRVSVNLEQEKHGGFWHFYLFTLFSDFLSSLIRDLQTGCYCLTHHLPCEIS